MATARCYTKSERVPLSNTQFSERNKVTVHESHHMIKDNGKDGRSRHEKQGTQGLATWNEAIVPPLKGSVGVVVIEDEQSSAV